MKVITGLPEVFDRQITRYANVPSKQLIVKRIRSRFNGLCFTSLVNVAADEVEKILYELTKPYSTQRYEFATPIVKRLRPRSDTEFFSTGYTCPVCGFSDVHLKHSFCAGCGMKIKWIPVVDQKHMQEMIEKYYNA